MSTERPPSRPLQLCVQDLDELVRDISRDTIRSCKELEAAIHDAPPRLDELRDDG